MCSDIGGEEEEEEEEEEKELYKQYYASRDLERNRGREGRIVIEARVMFKVQYSSNTVHNYSARMMIMIMMTTVMMMTTLIMMIMRWRRGLWW